MFRREQHRKVAEILAALNDSLLIRCKFLFGGGTRIALELTEYRESHGIDFLCSDAEGYAEMRSEISSRGYDSLFRPAARQGFDLPREMRIDHYGIRFPILADGKMIRVELIREARIELDPGVRPAWSPVDCLSLADCYAEKLLANSDRWADRQALSRDLIDLSALRSKVGPIPEEAWSKGRGGLSAGLSRGPAQGAARVFHRHLPSAAMLSRTRHRGSRGDSDRGLPAPARPRSAPRAGVTVRAQW